MAESPPPRLRAIEARGGHVLTLTVRRFDDAAAGLRASLHALRSQGDAGARGRTLSAQDARTLLSWERLSLLRAIRDGRPSSMSALAQAVNRALEGVQRDVAFLEKIGAVIVHDRARGRGRWAEAPYREIRLTLEV
ncbi:MAG: hypothetical protein HY294_14765 [Candidatus Rokubacteria bacterium]|nr:hypothetical protein [Candidatus Rokubacteria bacterium]MBI3827252.1 hypothetical protein [Candidatus Rokubacteria bacterium]